MRLRTARKICKAVETVRGHAYSAAQIERAGRRVDRTKSARADRGVAAELEFWDQHMGAVRRLRAAEREDNHHA